MLARNLNSRLGLSTRAFSQTALRSQASSSPVTIDLRSEFEYHHIKPEDGPSKSITLPGSDLVKMYRNMVLMRRMETAADALYKQKLIRGFCHLNIGQEAVSVGIEGAINRDDAIITAYRCHGFAMMRGGSIKSILAELMGTDSYFSGQNSTTTMC
jgi:pyruvate dehydrogenase E1 component alpha subunit